MPPFLQVLFRRIIAVPVSFVLITMLLYAGVMMTPPESRAACWIWSTTPLNDWATSTGRAVELFVAAS